MSSFGRVCYAVCQLSIAACLLLALIMIWGEVTDEFMSKAMGTALACFFASGLAFAVNREVQKEPGHNDQDRKA